MHLNKALDLADFDHPELVAEMRRALGFGPTGPLHYAAKAWEIGMTALALRTCGALRPDSELLGVGAGRESTLFYLTTCCKRVFATDLYAGSGSWSADAPPVMLIDPASVAPGHIPFDRRRLVTQHMNGLDLRYPNDSFDGIFSCGSIEHFGSRAEISQAAAEMARW